MPHLLTVHGTIGNVDVTLLFFDSCPNWRKADARIRQALREIGAPPGAVTLRRVETPEEAEQLSFRGSPTVLINGDDPFADPSAPVGVSCRVYRTADGLVGVPPVAALVAALHAAR